MPEINTFSIVAYCPRSGQLGVAVATALPAVGSLCPFVRPGVGAVSTQSWVNPYLALDALDQLALGQGAVQTLELVLTADPHRERRQIGVVDATGQAAGHTGKDCTPWYGHHVGDHCAVQGNMLAGPEVLSAMVAAFEHSSGAALDERLMVALEAGQGAGGDKRGQQSAALLVYGREAYPYLDLRIDDAPNPVVALRQLLERARQQLRPFIDSMPRRGGDEPEPLDEAATAMLLSPPPARPGGGGAAP